MYSPKIQLLTNVFEASLERIQWSFSNFERICISFSGGKDSTVMFHLTAMKARQLNRKINILFVDWEAQFSHTIAVVEAMQEQYKDVIEKFYWVALPLTTANAVSQFQPEWVCWQEGVPWVRQPPENAITDISYFPFYKPAMSFEDFVREFSEWFSASRPAAVMIGIRADESYNRFLSIVSGTKSRFADDKPWTTATPKGHAYNIYPLYDWKTADIWTWFSQTGETCNALYSLMYQAGVPMRYMRVCEPFGLDQRQGLWLYHVLEPERWALMCERVSGANSGCLYASERGDFYARRQINKPQHITWREYALALLDSLPEVTAEHYRNKFAVYLHWYLTRGYPDDIPDAQDNDSGSKDIPSWRRICKVLLNNDYWCRALSFSPNKSASYRKYCHRIQKKRQQWKII
jgi:predicted phosphoadenosine phosphosulfate sulfurtransferase